jgi:hypothetical protein
MSFNRLMYDSNTENVRLSDSMGPGNYVLQTPAPSYPCYPDNAQIIPQRSGFISNVNTENHLLNLNTPATKWPIQPEQYYSGSQYGFEPDCNLRIQNTRLSNPPSTLRGTGWNRFDPICEDPQANIFFPGKKLIDTRALFKDKHVPRIPQIRINDMNPEKIY